MVIDFGSIDGQAHLMTSLRRALLFSSITLAACTGGGDDGDDDVPGAPTYYQDIKPIVDAKCTTCHFDGGIAPFELTDFASVRDHGGEASLEIAAGRMPPWPPNPDCNEYFADRSLTEEQKATFLAWVDALMPEGDPDDEAPPLDVEDVSLSRVDLTLTMEAEYTPQTTEDYPDEYRCFVLPMPAEWETNKYVTGFRAVPGNPSVVHHVIAFYAGPDLVDDYLALDAGEAGDGYTCFGGSGGPTREMIGGWAPGTLGSDFPPGTGLLVEPGSAVVMQVHYNVLTAGAEPDLTSVQMRIDDTVERVAEVMPWANPAWLEGGMPIPAGDEDVEHSFAFDASFLHGGDFTIYSAALHQHQLGTRSIATIERASGDSECLLQIDDWNFHWQGSYGLREPPVFHPGDELRIECHWDNSADNQPMIDGEPREPTDVNWGEGTTEEMCVGFFYVVPE
jgi:hypothetical protein